jgi:hypothetical protein
MFWTKTKDKMALDAAVRAAGKAATALTVESALLEEPIFAPTETHFGGNPYFEEGEIWPTSSVDGRPYDFVCQVNLKDCAHPPNVPFDLFTVFFCWECEGNLVAEPCLVRTYRDASVGKAVSVARPVPQGTGDYKVRPCVVRTEEFMTYPWSMKRFPQIASIAGRFKNPDLAFIATLKRLGFRHNYRSRIGGFPTWVHDDTFDGSDFVFLAQIDYEPCANNCIGDAAPIYIAVSAKDPTRIEIDTFQSF